MTIEIKFLGFDNPERDAHGYWSDGVKTSIVSSLGELNLTAPFSKAISLDAAVEGAMQTIAGFGKKLANEAALCADSKYIAPNRMASLGRTPPG